MTATAENIETLRTHIDAIDNAIITALADRIVLSRQARIAGWDVGGPATDLARERAVFATYQARLGTAKGQTIAQAILEVCRGWL